MSVNNAVANASGSKVCELKRYVLFHTLLELRLVDTPATVVHASVVGVFGVIPQEAFGVAAGVFLAGPFDDAFLFTKPTLVIVHHPLLRHKEDALRMGHSIPGTAGDARGK